MSGALSSERPDATGPYYDLGSYHRRVDTPSPEAQVWFDRGLVWAYGFNHEEAIRCFERALHLGWPDHPADQEHGCARQGDDVGAALVEHQRRNHACQHDQCHGLVDLQG